MKKSKKPKPQHGGLRNPSGGRPPIYGSRENWLIAVPHELAAAVDERRAEQSRAAVVAAALAAWLADPPPPA